ncbi:hypothetical protein F5888DRAFT_1907591 [Russula emetica]|nr:hypothetical protein F5888DRAFT_1907591 [Russula emetica]
MFTEFRALIIISTPSLWLFPLLKTPSEHSAFLLALCGTRVVFLSPKQFSSKLETEAEVILTLLIKLINGEIDADEPRPGLCCDAEFMRSVWQRCDALVTDGDTGSASSARLFTFLISALKFLVTSHPALLGVSAQMHGVGVPASDSQSHLDSHHSLDSVAEMVATAASATVSNVVGMIGTEAGLSVQTAAMKVQWCVSTIIILPTHRSARHCRQLDDKADAPLIPEAYIYLLGVQCLVSLPDGLAGYTFPFFNTLAVQKPPAELVHPPGPLDPTTLPETEPGRATNRAHDAERGLARASCGLSFLITRNLSDSIFGDALGTPQTLARAAGDAFLTALAKAALPPRVVAALDEPQQALFYVALPRLT